MKVRPALLIAAALLTAVAAAQAQEHESRQSKTSPAKTSSVQLGDKVILIPDPEGFEEGTSQFESFKKRMIATEAPQNDMLLAHLPVADCELLRKGSSPTYSHFSKVSVFRVGREMTLSRAAMAVGVEDFRKNVYVYLDPNGSTQQNLEKHVERNLSQLDSKETKVDLSKPQLLGEFDVRPDVNSFLMLMTYSVTSAGAEWTEPKLVTVSFVRVKERVIFVYSFLKYRSKADVDTAKQFSTKWTTSILAANQ
jgi:hypothetical protein